MVKVPQISKIFQIKIFIEDINFIANNKKISEENKKFKRSI